MSRVAAIFFAVVGWLLFGIDAHAQPNPSPNLNLGNAVVSGFSGVVAPDPRRIPRNKSAIDLTFINPDAPAARIFDVGAPGFAWDGRNWAARKTFDVLARQTGQVFGIALDDEANPNIYLTATSAYGLQIVVLGANNVPERVTKGQPRAQWMGAQFGPAPQGGPGSIWKVDGRSGQVSLFANVTLNGASNWGPGLGNIAFDRARRQLFVSDLATGMIHRFDLTGRELQTYDHGVSGRPARNLAPVAFDPNRRVEITDPRFDSENPDTFGYAAPERRVYAVAIHRDGRLYYSVWDGPQIWSVGIQPDGSIGSDPRWELDVLAAPRSFPVSDMVFSDQGAMILAQRGGLVSSYDYSVFARPGEARVLRYTLEQPDDPATPSRWVAQPDEYAVGFRGDFRNTDGGVDLGYGYTRDGRIDTNSCATALWATGESLRDNPAYATRLLPGGPFTVNGLQASPADQVRDRNAPPWTAYFIDYDGRYDDTRSSGHIGSVRILRADCAGVIAPPGAPGVIAQPPSLPPVGPPPLCPQGLNPDGTCGRVPIDLAIRKTASEGKYDAATGTWTFQFTLTVTNVGNPFVAANHIVINDPAPNGLTFTAAAGTNWTCPPAQFPVNNPNALNCGYNFGPGLIATGAVLPPLVITVTVANAGKFENCATTGIRGAPWLQETTQVNNRACATITVPVDLAIKKTAGEVKFDEKAGTWSYQYTLTITNVGAANNGPIQISDPVPAGLTFTSYTATGWTCALSTALTCTHTGPIAHNQTFTITINVMTKTPGKYENCATVGVTAASGLQETTLANNKDCVTITIIRPVVDLAIKKTVGDVKYDAATGLWTFQYTLDVTNAGNPFAPQNYIAINDPVPSGLTFMSASGSNWTCPGSFPLTTVLNCSYNFGTGQFITGAHLNPLTITVTTKEPGTYENCATVGIPLASGYQETTLANNKSCVTVVIRKTPPPPVLNPQCGVNVIFVVDVSTSIVTAGATNQVQSALNNAKSLFNNTNASGVPAQGAVVTFSTGAQVLQPMSAGTLSTFPALTFGGDTNWEAGLQLAYTLAQAGPQPALIVFISDGEPNYYVDNAGTNQFTSNAALATTEAQAVVSQIYGLNPPVPILGIGIGNITTYLNQLLGGNFQQSSFGALDGDLQSFAKKACPDLYLYKSINPSFINYYNNPGPHQATITLTLQNTNGALTNVQVKDVLPAQLTNPTSTDPNFSAAGNTVTWTLASVAANATVTLSFKVDIVPPALTCNWSTVRNTAQVTAVTPPVHSLPGNMPAGGPHEHDEAAATLWLQDCKPIIGDQGPPYLQVTKSSLESCFPQGQSFTPGVGATQTPPPACTFTVKVQAIGNFVGNVTFSDSVIPSPGTAPVNTGIASITVTPPPLPSTQPNYCFQSFTTTPNSCQQNITLNNGHVISFTITLKAPPNLAAGQYKNCFVAAKDTLPAAQQTWNPYYAATPTSWGWYNWGYCGLFGVPAAPVGIAPPPGPQCDPGTTIRRGNECVCRFPNMAKTPDGACACAREMDFVPGRGCVPRVVCTPPKILNAAGRECVCPEGTTPRGQECIRQPDCRLPMVPGPTGIPGVMTCVCPAPLIQRGQECVPRVVCTPPKILNAAGRECVCPEGTTPRGRECVRLPDCRPPMVQGPGGRGCICPPGTQQRGRECVRPPECRPPMVQGPGGRGCICPPGTQQRGRECVRPPECRPPMVQGPGGRGCICPPGMQQRGRECVRPGPTRPESGGPRDGGPRETPRGGPVR